MQGKAVELHAVIDEKGIPKITFSEGFNLKHMNAFRAALPMQWGLHTRELRKKSVANAAKIQAEEAARLASEKTQQEADEAKAKAILAAKEAREKEELAKKQAGNKLEPKGDKPS